MRTCGARLAPDQWWNFCGETDMGQTLPVQCTACGGDMIRADDPDWQSKVERANIRWKEQSDKAEQERKQKVNTQGWVPHFILTKPINPVNQEILGNALEGAIRIVIMGKDGKWRRLESLEQTMQFVEQTRKDVLQAVIDRGECQYNEEGNDWVIDLTEWCKQWRDTGSQPDKDE